MKSSVLFLFVLVMLFSSCTGQRSSLSDSPLTAYQLDSLLGEGGNHYDVASLLYRNPDFFYNSPRSFREGGRLSYDTSLDGQFRVYSIELQGNYPFIDNIIQCGDSRSTPLLMMEAIEDKGPIYKIGMHNDGHRTIYLPVSFQYFCCGGEYISAAIRSFSIIRDSSGFSILSEPIFKTKHGRLLDSIEVDWDDNCGKEPSNNIFCIDWDNPDNVNEIYIQVIDADTGIALNKAIVYRWDGIFFNYAGIVSKTYENYSE